MYIKQGRMITPCRHNLFYFLYLFFFILLNEIRFVENRKKNKTKQITNINLPKFSFKKINTNE